LAKTVVAAYGGVQDTLLALETLQNSGPAFEEIKATLEKLTQGHVVAGGEAVVSSLTSEDVALAMSTSWQFSAIPPTTSMKTSASGSGMVLIPSTSIAQSPRPSCGTTTEPAICVPN